MTKRLIIGAFIAGVVFGIVLVNRVPIKKLAIKAERKVELAINKLKRAIR